MGIKVQKMPKQLRPTQRFCAYFEVVLTKKSFRETNGFLWVRKGFQDGMGSSRGLGEHPSTFTATATSPAP
jgi:hypothetical protein